MTIPGFDPRIYQAIAQSLYHSSIPNLSVNYFKIFRSFDAVCVLNSFLQFIDVIGLWGWGHGVGHPPTISPKVTCNSILRSDLHITLPLPLQTYCMISLVPPYVGTTLMMNLLTPFLRSATISQTPRYDQTCYTV